MDLEQVLARCRAFETRAGSIYRSYAARTRHDPEVCAMWTAMARDEESHAKAIGRAAGWLDRAQGWHTSLQGWDDDLHEIEARLAHAESPEIGADVDRQLAAALALERTELDSLFHRLLAIMPAVERGQSSHDHTGRLLDAAARRSGNPTVAFEAALLHAHHRLRDAS